MKDGFGAFPRSRNWARYAAVREVALSGFVGVCAAMAIWETRSADSFLILVIVLLLWSLLRVAKAMTSKLMLTQNGIEFRDWFRNRTIDYADISSLTSSRWDGGWFMIGQGPAWIRVLEVRVKKSRGETVSLDFAFMPQKKMDQLILKIRSRAEHEIKGYKPEVGPVRLGNHAKAPSRRAFH